MTLHLFFLDVQISISQLFEMCIPHNLWEILGLSLSQARGILNDVWQYDLKRQDLQVDLVVQSQECSSQSKGLVFDSDETLNRDVSVLYTLKKSDVLKSSSVTVFRSWTFGYTGLGSSIKRTTQDLQHGSLGYGSYFLVVSKLLNGRKKT